MKRRYSLKKKKEFNFVYRRGKGIGSKILVLVYVKTRNETKIGFSVSKKVGNAVIRNKTKRRLREAVTPLIPRIKANHQLIFIARHNISTTSYSNICKTIEYLLNKANLLNND